MTKKELSQLYYLNREIKQQQSRVDELEAMLSSCTTQASVQGSGDTAPFTKHSITVRGIDMSKYAYYSRRKSELAELKRVIELNMQKCWYEQNKLIRYIATIPDSFTRLIFSLRYINGMSWQRIANEIGNNTSDSVRKHHDRFLAQNKAS